MSRRLHWKLSFSIVTIDSAVAGLAFGTGVAIVDWLWGNCDWGRSGQKLLHQPLPGRAKCASARPGHIHGDPAWIAR
ncbi:MAG: hypothetical protein DI560_06210 [Pseudomonas putida]|nr:MAG: hypothetical protein DI560_06210 [Pseudomonas putida]